MDENAKHLIECLACGSTDLKTVLDLNAQPLANSFTITADEPEPSFPLAVNHCNECNHLQLTHAVNPEIIYRDYLYVSGTSKTYLDYMDWYAEWTMEQYQMRHPINRKAMSVLDIGCNDGSQLDAFMRRGNIKTCGVDPAENLYASSTVKGHTVVCGFWNANSADLIRLNSNTTAFDIVTSQNAFAHIPDPLSYLKLVRTVMNDDGLLFISTSQSDMVLRGEFDTIYHEHISFYNASSMAHLAERAGLYLNDVIKTPIHGISYVFVLGRRPRTGQLSNILAMEKMQGLQDVATYDDWARGVRKLLERLPHEIDKARDRGMRVIGYGAAAKGMTLLNATKIKMDAVVDDNPLKQGRFTPGMAIPVVGPEYIDQIPADQPVLFVPLAWNFFDEIVKRIRARRSQDHDEFLKYFPRIEHSKYVPRKQT